ncbi:MAG TPA: VOC family protein [Myxococcota bacterium]|nr:VOC family protein [Myxococcota bacterium]
MGIQRVGHLGICVSDLPRSLRFYRDLLGFRELSSLDVAGPHADRLLGLKSVKLRAVYLERDGMRIELLAFASPEAVGAPVPQPMNQLGLTHLSIRVRDLSRVVEELRAAGACVLEATAIDAFAAGSGAIFVTDPDGTRIELVELPGDPAAPPR